MKTKKGQILIITLLVLTILSIVTVSLIVLNSRDVTQTVNSEIYEKVYNSSETKLKEVLGVLPWARNPNDVRRPLLPVNFSLRLIPPKLIECSAALIPSPAHPQQW